MFKWLVWLVIKDWFLKTWKHLLGAWIFFSALAFAGGSPLGPGSIVLYAGLCSFSIVLGLSLVILFLKKTGPEF